MNLADVLAILKDNPEVRHTVGLYIMAVNDVETVTKERDEAKEVGNKLMSQATENQDKINELTQDKQALEAFIHANVKDQKLLDEIFN